MDCFFSIIITNKCSELNLSFQISEKKDQNLYLKENSDYYHQIQGQLHITNKMCCDLIVWTQADLVVVRIAKDEKWTVNIEKIINFYFKKFIPEVNKK